MECHPPGCRRADQPVAGQSNQEGGLGIFEPAYAAHGDGLRAVEQLEPGGDGQQAHGQFDDRAERWIIMVQEQANQLMRQQPENHREAEHRRRSEHNTNPSCQPCIQQLPGTVVLADAHGDRVGHAGRHHEGHRNDLQGNLVRTQLRAAHGAHAQRCEGKQPDLHRVGAADGQAQPPQLLEVLTVGPRQAFTQWISVIRPMPPNMQGQRQRHQVGDDGRDQPDPHQPHLGQAEHAGDQRIVEQEIRHRAGEADHHHRCRPADRTGEAAQGHEAQVAGQGERQDHQELPGHMDVAFGLAEQQQHGLEVPQQQAGGQCHQPRQPQTCLGQPGGANDIARTLTDSYQGADCRNHPNAENRHKRVGGRTQAAAGKRLGANARHHQGVGEDHQHMRQLRGNQRPRQPQNGPEFNTRWMLHDHHARFSEGTVDRRFSALWRISTKG